MTDTEKRGLLTPYGITNIVMALTLYSVFIGLFYFTYIVKIEHKTVDTELTNLINNIGQDLKFLPQEQKDYILSNYFNNISAPDMTKQDADVDASNKKILILAFKVLGVFFIIGAIFVTAMTIKYNLNIKQMIFINLFLLLIVAITEILFLNLVTIKYSSIDQNAIKKIILNQLTKT